MAKWINWKSTVEPIEAPPFISSQNVSSSVPVMPQWYRGLGLCNEPRGVGPRPPRISRPSYEDAYLHGARNRTRVTRCPRSFSDGRRTLRLPLIIPPQNLVHAHAVHGMLPRGRHLPEAVRAEPALSRVCSLFLHLPALERVSWSRVPGHRGITSNSTRGFFGSHRL